MPVTTYGRAAAAPTPPNGPTTYTALVAMVVGVIIAVLSLFDVVPTAEDTQAIGTIVGAVIALVAFVVSAISRTKQANNLARLAAAERRDVRRENPQLLVAGGAIPKGTAVMVGEGGRVAPVPSARPAKVPTEEEIAGWRPAPKGHGAGRRAVDDSDHDTRPRGWLDPSLRGDAVPELDDEAKS